MVVEAEYRLPFPPGRRRSPAGDGRDQAPLGHGCPGRRSAGRGLALRPAKRYPSAAGIAVARSWAGLYDMTPDAHPVIGLRGICSAACGFSGHGFMQAPAVGKAVAEELLDGESSFDLTPYRLERFSGDEIFPETLVL